MCEYNFHIVLSEEQQTILPFVLDKTKFRTAYKSFADTLEGDQGTQLRAQTKFQGCLQISVHANSDSSKAIHSKVL